MQDSTPAGLSLSGPSRSIERIVQGQPASDGAGVRLTRVLTPSVQRRLDPFLLLDAFASDSASDYIGGFPSHPHRGFETVTYMLAGRMRHRDSAGHTGLLEPGSVQWMTAGRGIVHSEMPEQAEGRMAGFQLWVNLAAKDKLSPPAYREIAPSDVPSFKLEDGTTVRVIAGISHGVQGAVTRPVTEPIYLDIGLPPHAVFEQPLPAAHNAFVYVHGGRVEIEGTPVETGYMGILANGAHLAGARLRAAANGARVLLIGGQPLDEPIVQHGPFVMNTAEEIRQAVQDFRLGRLALAQK